MTVRIHYKKNWYQFVPYFMDVSDCPSLEQVVKQFRIKNPEWDFLSAEILEA